MSLPPHIDIAEDFLEYLSSTSPSNSHKGGSYVQAIHIMNELFSSQHPEMFGVAGNLWFITDSDRLKSIQAFVKSETKKPNGGIFEGVASTSYWKKGFCSAALGALIPFQQMMLRKKGILLLAENSTDPAKLAKELEAFELSDDSNKKDDAGIAITSLEGKDRIVLQKARENQQKFRTVVLWNYKNECCISGLPIVQSLQASHISDWSENKEMRLNPTNGLCLAAHYHLAFDNHLITLDEKYRLVISRSLRDYVNNEAYQDQFVKFEGKQIRMPKRYNPSQALLSKHREQLV